MAAVNFELKNYQQASLNAFRQYLSDANSMGPKLAFYKATDFPFKEAPLVEDGTPYVCLRIPTGGGKTICAAHSVGIAAKEYLQTPSPMVLWLVPSTPILEQTLSALKNVDHPYRAALAADFGQNVTILTKEEALSVSRPDAEGGACIIVATIQSFRREKDNGKENPEGLKVYEDNGALMEHFTGLSEDQKANLHRVEGTDRPIASLANLLRLHRPMVIVDEAHNARTALSFDTLARFRPSLILELTATPQTEHKPDKGQYASNILHSVSAAELKAEQMIKMPIRLTTDGEWQKTIGAACDCQAMLEEAARAEQEERGEYIRPIILFQAQSSKKDDDTRLTWERIEEHLVAERGIPKDRVAVHTGPRKDLDGIDIENPSCPVRFIITVQKLKEGWDCPFAYVFCSVAEQTSATAVEQILGRVLRLPKAKLKVRDALNQAYAFVASKNFNDTANQLKDGLVEGAGFERLEAEHLVKPQNFGFGESEEGTEFTIDADDTDGDTLGEILSSFDRAPDEVRKRVTVDPDKKTISFRGPMSRNARNVLQLAAAKHPSAARHIDRLYVKSNRLQTSEQTDEEKPPFLVPLLAKEKQGELHLFTQDDFLDLPWRLDECDASPIVDRFEIKDRSQSGRIDVSEKGQVEVEFIRNIQRELSEIVREPTWSVPRLCNWLDRGIRHPDVTKPSAIIFLQGALKALTAERYSLDDLARHKFQLRDALAAFIGELRSERERGNYDALFAAEADTFATSADIAVLFDPDNYPLNQPYSGGRKWRKHYMPMVGDLKASGEEFDCACHIDSLDEVRYWVRNLERKPNSFWLQLPDQKFYPDFVAMLKDGRTLVVEYKGGHLYEGEAVKRQIGDVWADVMKGQGLFCMPTERDFSLIDRTIRGN